MSDILAEVRHGTFGDAIPDMLYVLNGTAAEDGLNIQYFDRSRLQAEYLSILERHNERAHNKLFSAMENLHSGLKVVSATTRELNDMAYESVLEPVPVRRYLSLSHRFQQETADLEHYIETVRLSPSLLNEELLKGAAKLDFTPLQQHYISELNKLKQRTAQMQFRLQLPSRALYQQQGLDASALLEMQLYTSDELAEMRRQVVLLKNMPTRDRQVIDQNFNDFTKRAQQFP